MEIHGVHEPRGPTDHTSNSRGWWDPEGWAWARLGKRCPVRGTDSPLPPSNSQGLPQRGGAGKHLREQVQACSACSHPPLCPLDLAHHPRPPPTTSPLLQPAVSLFPRPPLAALLLCPLFQPHGVALSLLSPCLHLFPDFRSHLPIKAPERAVSSLVRPPS